MSGEVVEELGNKRKGVRLPFGDGPIVIVVNRAVGFEGLAGFGRLAASDNIDDEALDV